MVANGRPVAYGGRENKGRLGQNKGKHRRTTMNTSHAKNPLAVRVWDFGGVILSSPFEAFNRYEAGSRTSQRFRPRPQCAQSRR